MATAVCEKKPKAKLSPSEKAERNRKQEAQDLVPIYAYHSLRGDTEVCEEIESVMAGLGYDVFGHKL